MYSAELDLSLFQRVSEELPVDEGKLLSHFEEFMRVFRSLKKLCADNLSKDTEGNDIGFYFSTDPPFVFTEALNKFLSSLENHSKKHRNEPIYEILYDVLSSIRSYLGILEYYDEHFRTYILVYGGDIKVKAYCIDPSLVLDKCMARACSSVLFSATLTPAEYFADVLG
ncbi:MAG: hypothetical protein U0M06_03740, partial [Clostridia bacterium]|nr:hypothetical protein [Clostridia bacterium]